MATHQDDPRHTFILRTQADWHKWLLIIKDTAIYHGVWELVNPDTTQQPQPLVEPLRPQPSHFKAAATSITDLSVEEREIYAIGYIVYQDIKKDWSEKLRGLSEINNLITGTIPSSYIYVIQTKDTPRERILALKDHFSPHI
jgi:hypothetical protein